MNDDSIFLPDCLFYIQPRSASAECSITGSGTTDDNRHWVTLSASPLFPRSGGQACDCGTINAIQVTDITVEDGRIMHWLPQLPDGKDASVTVDISRAQDIAVQHTAQHLLSAAILSQFGYATRSMHIGADVNTIDVDTPSFTRQQSYKAVQVCSTIIAENRPVIIHWCPPENIETFALRKKPPESSLIRIVDIGGFDYSPCCAPHVQSTGLIGQIAILSCEKYKGMTRITFAAGRRAADAYLQLQTSAEETASALKTSVLSMPGAAATLQEKMKHTEQELRSLKTRIASIEAERILSEYSRSHNAEADTEHSVISFTRDENFNDVLDTARALQKLTGRIIAAASSVSLKAAVLTATPSIDIKTTMQPLLLQHNAKGGGSRSMITATFTQSADMNAFMASAARGGADQWQ